MENQLEPRMYHERVHYRIRFPKEAGKFGEWYTTNNGTSQWSSQAKIKALLTTGKRSGYKGQYHTPFTDYEVVKVTEQVVSLQEVVKL